MVIYAHLATFALTRGPSISWRILASTAAQRPSYRGGKPGLPDHGVGAVGDRPAQQAAIANLRDAVEALLAEVAHPDELTLTLNVT